MSGASTSELLAVWVAGERVDHTGRALLLAGAAGGSPEAPADLTVGERDGLLLDLRRALFGDRVTALGSCPACAESLELDFELDAVRAAGVPDGTVRVETDGFVVEARPPTSRDLVVAAGRPDIAAAHRALLERCVVRASRAGVPVPAADLPESVARAVGRALGDADPQADVELALTCAACGHRWATRFDVAEFLWQELDRSLRGVLGEVHRLARAYGWSEADILALPAGRRRRYLELLADG